MSLSLTLYPLLSTGSTQLKKCRLGCKESKQTNKLKTKFVVCCKHLKGLNYVCLPLPGSFSMDVTIELTLVLK